jgi:hypothetical protein
MPAMPYRLYNKDTGALLGDVTEAQVQVLIDVLEEENDQDRDYWIDADTLELLAEEGADAALIALLQPHVGDGENDDEGIEVEWRKT